MTTENQLDLKGFTCPVPLLRTKKALKTLSAGDTLTLLITDPNTKGDLTRFCRKGSCKIIHESSQDDHDVFILEKL